MEGFAAAIDRYREARLALFSRMNGCGTVTVVLLSLAMSCFTGIMAQVAVYLPWTPVPVTGQTLAVLIAAMVLGRRGALSQVFYIAIGLAGVPWFAGAVAGPAVIAGPTFGYLAGFVVTAYLVGLVLERYESMRRIIPLVIIMGMANLVVILGLGTLYLYVWITAVKGEPPSLQAILYMGAIPFIPGAVVKTFLAAFIGMAIMPKERFRI
ncbi:MAG TPA: biotin transporter BioY [Spirochaetota bacterium]|nr:biotin transporter BioY [Spirochaetota bacterium]